MSETALEDAPVAGDVVDANADPDVVVEASTDPVETPAPAPYDPYEDPRVLELIDQRAATIADQQFRQALAEAQAHAQRDAAPASLSTPNFFDEEGNFLPQAFAEFQTARDEQIASRFDKALEQITAPLQAREMQETAAEGEARIKDMIADDVSRHGEFPKDPETGKSSAEALIRPLADALFPSIASQYGNSARSAELAVGRAASIVRALVKEAQTAGVTEHVNRNARLAGVPAEPAPGASGVVTFPEGPQPVGSIAERYGRSAWAIRNGNTN